MIEERKPDASSQPSFAERVARFEAWAREDEYKLNRVVELVPDLLACIREQQAALETAINIAEHSGCNMGQERAVLARWRIE